MTGLTVLKFILETLVVIAISYGFYKEEAVVKFEKKAFRFIRRFFKVVISEIKQSRESKRVEKIDNIVEFRADNEINDQYEYLLNLEKIC